jgi:ribosomal protein S18 acetylase RimI-like enzyme
LLSEYRNTPFSLQDGLSEWKGDGGLLIAQQDDDLVGLLRMDKHRTYWGLSSFVLDSAYRGQGHGTVMLKLATNLGDPVLLKVQQDNPAYNMYRRGGFHAQCVSNGRVLMKHGNK